MVRNCLDLGGQLVIFLVELTEVERLALHVGSPSLWAVSWTKRKYESEMSLGVHTSIHCPPNLTVDVM